MHTSWFVPRAVALFLFVSAGCCLPPKPESVAQHAKTATDLGSLPVSTVIADVSRVLLDQKVKDALEASGLIIKAVKLVLQLEDDTAGDAKVAVLASVEGTITRSTTKMLTLQFSLPSPSAKALEPTKFPKPTLETKDLLDAIKAAAESATSGKEMAEKLGLKDKEFDYEVDFLLTKTVAGGIDISIGKVGLTAVSTLTRKDGDQIVITLGEK